MNLSSPIAYTLLQNKFPNLMALATKPNLEAVVYAGSLWAGMCMIWRSMELTLARTVHYTKSLFSLKFIKDDFA